MAKRRDSRPSAESPRVDGLTSMVALTAPESVVDASVVICAYTEDRWDDIVAAVESLERQTLAPAEVILVIDHNDRLFERAKSLKGVVTVRNVGTRGASGSRNSGVAAASGSIVAFLDDDAIAGSDWLEVLAAAYAQPNVAGVGGSIEPGWPAKAPGWFPEEFNWVVGATYVGWRTTTGPVRNLIGANMSVRRDVWERIGGFREGFGLVTSAAEASGARKPRSSWGEENEFCIRVSQAYPQLQWIYEPRACVQHRIQDRRCTWRYFLSRSREEGMAKAHLASAVGRERALGTERSYATKTLPAGVLSGVRDAIANGDIDGLKRAGAIVAGFSMTTIGFLEGRARFSEWLPR